MLLNTVFKLNFKLKVDPKTFTFKTLKEISQKPVETLISVFQNLNYCKTYKLVLINFILFLQQILLLSIFRFYKYKVHIKYSSVRKINFKQI